MMNIIAFSITTKERAEREVKFLKASRNLPPTEINFIVGPSNLKKGDRLKVKLPKFNLAVYIITSIKNEDIIAVFEKIETDFCDEEKEK